MGYGTLPGLLITDTTEAAQKWNLSSSPHRRRRSGDDSIGPDEHPIFPNGYAAILNKSPPPAPPAFLRRIGVKELTGVGKSRERPLRTFESRVEFPFRVCLSDGGAFRNSSGDPGGNNVPDSTSMVWGSILFCALLLGQKM
ncbi:hypothetical protein KQX54_014589 [Cotesia glomerata]|uniref:Uncharacterized protein n=1 Tax=Cotesia glomerata TaxID=32391 RepID=A0AAV7IKE9_COTGL|nr:hypothetical protein KQX54_014589 [Cotesia glomerata]